METCHTMSQSHCESSVDESKTTKSKSGKVTIWPPSNQFSMEEVDKHSAKLANSKASWLQYRPTRLATTWSYSTMTFLASRRWLGLEFLTTCHSWCTMFEEKQLETGVDPAGELIYVPLISCSSTSRPSGGTCPWRECTWSTSPRRMTHQKTNSS